MLGLDISRGEWADEEHEGAEEQGEMPNAFNF